MTALFDAYRGSYRDEVEAAISFGGQELEFFTELKARYLLEVIARHVGDPGEVAALDVGCGVGLSHPFLAPSFRELWGADVSSGALEAARRANPGVQYAVSDETRLPFSDGAFDVVVAVCVLHHVAPVFWVSFASEMARVARPDGLVVVFEHNPYNPATRRVVARCVFDADAVLLSRRRLERVFGQSGLDVVESRHIVFFPWRRRGFQALDRRLGRVPLGAQHLVAGRVPG